MNVFCGTWVLLLNILYLCVVFVSLGWVLCNIMGVPCVSCKTNSKRFYMYIMCKHSAKNMSKENLRVSMLDSKMLCLMTVASVVCTVHRSIVYNYIYTLVRSVLHAQGGLWYLVCVSFCSYSGSIIYRLWGGPLVIPTASAWKMKWRFSWNDCVQEIYMPRKQAKKSMYWHTVNWSGRSVYLGGKGTTKGVYRLTHAIY